MTNSIAPSPQCIIVENDQTTPYNFVVEMLQHVFALRSPEARKLASDSHWYGEAALGWYPPSVAEALIAECRRRVSEAGVALRLSVRDGGEHANSCAVCAKQGKLLTSIGNSAFCDSCRVLVAQSLAQQTATKSFKHAHELLQWHFAGHNADDLITTSRTFPAHMRADVYLAAREFLDRYAEKFVGIEVANQFEPLIFSALLKTGNSAKAIAPVSYEEMDTGDTDPVSCPENGLWLIKDGELRAAILMALNQDYRGGSSIRLEIAAPSGLQSVTMVDALFKSIADAVAAARSYRGKVLSLEGGDSYSGQTTGLMVHRLSKVERDEVILPAETLDLLDRNVLSFAKQRRQLIDLGLSAKKGILFYGPPGTGKTHTIRYLAGALDGHTTLLVTSEQAGLLGEYFKLARLLQPSLLVIEDADLIARSRESMGSACEEVLLNKLLNEMDGLKEDAEIFFVMTTNRPQHLEAALAGRPGRIDQAIEVPLPDAIGRTKLLLLYAGGLVLEPEIVRAISARTEGVSAAFIKELMRRLAQRSVAREGQDATTLSDVDEALQDMLFRGGRLNAQLLGGNDAGVCSE